MLVLNTRNYIYIIIYFMLIYDVQLYVHNMYIAVDSLRYAHKS